MSKSQQPQHQRFINSLPELFDTEFQKAALCKFLWSDTNKNIPPETIIHYLRLYDMVRRFYYVKTLSEPTPDTVLNLIDFIESNKDLRNFFSQYCISGTFPSTDTMQLLK